MLLTKRGATVRCDTLFVLFGFPESCEDDPVLLAMAIIAVIARTKRNSRPAK
jgi:hypothetical protein